MNLFDNGPVDPVKVPGYPLIKPRVQRPAIPAVPLDAVIVPAPTVALAFGEFLGWVVEQFTLHIAPLTAVTGVFIKGWDYDLRTDKPDKSPVVIVHFGTKEGVDWREHFLVGGLSWIDTNKFWQNRAAFNSIELRNAEEHGLEEIPREDAV